MKKNIIKILSSLLGVFVFITVAIASPLSAKWYTQSLDVSVGQEVSINLFVNPDEYHPIVTVSNTLKYDPNLLEFVRTDFDSDWFVLSDEPNFLTDTDNGVIRRTGGIAKGVNFEKKFITYVFKAKNAGAAHISIEQGNAYDQENTDIGLQNKDMTINISPITSAKENDVSVPAAQPTNEINLGYDLIAPTAVHAGQNFEFLVPIDNSSNETGEIEVSLLDNLRQVVFTSRRDFSVTDGSSIKFMIPAFALKEGNYFLNVKSIYKNSNKTYETEKPIGVLASDRSWLDIHKNELSVCVMFLLMIAFIYHLHRDHEYFRAMRRNVLRKK